MCNGFCSLMDALDKYSVGVPPVLWLPWTPQLLNCMVLYEGNVILNLLCQVGRMFPQTVYFPVRILYLTLRTATARKTTTVQVSTVCLFVLSVLLLCFHSNQHKTQHIVMEHKHKHKTVVLPRQQQRKVQQLKRPR